MYFMVTLLGRFRFGLAPTTAMVSASHGMRPMASPRRFVNEPDRGLFSLDWRFIGLARLECDLAH